MMPVMFLEVISAMQEPGAGCLHRSDRPLAGLAG